MKITTLDTTLRDGAGSSNVSFSNSDKIKIVKLMDELGIDLIEVGNPAYSAKNATFFEELPSLSLKHARIAVFGATCRPFAVAAEDEALLSMATCGVRDAVLFGKAWDLHVTDVLKTTLEENLRMIEDSICFLCARGMRVIFDAEHFFDGYVKNRDYAIRVLKTAEKAGAETVVLCDTNGGTFPDEISEITADAIQNTTISVGIHTHNDSGFAVANAAMAVAAGAVHIQGTLNGVGERCGNASLATVIANLQLKRGYEIIPTENMNLLTPISRAVAEISNISLRNQPYVSRQAFSHKAGMHIDGILKNSVSFEHIEPSLVGNRRNLLISDIAGRSAVMHVMERIAPDSAQNAALVEKIVKKVKELEFGGYQFDAADASLELVIRRELGMYRKHFTLKSCRVISEYDPKKERSYCSAFIRVMVDEKEENCTVDASGPVHAIDMALRKALNGFYPTLTGARFTDYKVRALNTEEAAAGAMTRVLIETTDNEMSWTTVGVSKNVIEASLNALVDSIEFKLIKSDEKAL